MNEFFSPEDYADAEKYLEMIDWMDEAIKSQADQVIWDVLGQQLGRHVDEMNHPSRRRSPETWAILGANYRAFRYAVDWTDNVMPWLISLHPAAKVIWDEDRGINTHVSTKEVEAAALRLLWDAGSLSFTLQIPSQPSR